MSALTSLLVRDQVVSVRTIEEAIQRQVISGGELDTVLLELDAVPEDTLAAYCGAIHGLPSTTRQQVMEVEPAVLGRVPREVAEDLRVVPLAVEGGYLTVAIASPPDPAAWEQLASQLGLALSPRIVTEARLAMALAKHYGADLPPRMRRLQKKMDVREAGVVPYVKPPEANRLDPARFDVRPKDREPERVLSEPPDAAGRSTMQFGAVPPTGGAPAGPAPDAPVPGAAPTAAAPAPPSTSSAVSVGVSRVVGVGAAPAPASPAAPAPASPAGPAPAPAANKTERMVAVPPATAAQPAPPAMDTQELASVSEAMERIGQARTRDEILDTLLAYARTQFQYTALFVVHDGVAEGRSAVGQGGASSEQVREMAVPLSASSTLAEVQRSAGPKVARFDTSEVDEGFLRDMGRQGAQPSVLIPVAIRQRVVLILYGDRGGDAVGFADVPDLLGLAAQVGAAFERLIVQRKFQGYASTEKKSGDARLQPDKLALPARPERPSRASWEPPAAAQSPAPEASDPAAPSPAPDSSDPAASTAAASAPAAADGPSPGAPGRGRPVRSARRTVMGLPAADVPVTDSWGGSAPPAAAPARSAEGPTQRGVPRGERPSELNVLGVPRSAPPPPGHPPEASDRWFPRDTVPEMARPQMDEAQAAAEDDDEPELTVDYDTDSSADALEDYDPDTVGAASDPPPGTRRDPRRDDPEGVATHDVVRLGRTAAAAADAIRVSRAGSTSSPPVDPDPDQPSVIVDMGRNMESSVRDLSLSGPDDTAAVQGVLAQGEAVLPVLVQHFPGPLWFDRHRPYRRLPAGRDVSPIARALDAFGERAVPYVASLLSANLGDTRFYAVLLAADLPHPDLVPPLAERAFDPDAGVRARALHVLPRFARFTDAYEAELAEIRKFARVPRKSPERRAQAVEALGHLRDVASMDLLIKLLDDDEPETRLAARRSLVLLTCQDFGEGPKRWAAWLDKNCDRHRIEWLIDALNHSDEALRSAAGEELQQLSQQYFGFHPQLAKREREVMQRRYQQWWATEGAARFRGG